MIAPNLSFFMSKEEIDGTQIEMSDNDIRLNSSNDLSDIISNGIKNNKETEEGSHINDIQIIDDKAVIDYTADKDSNVTINIIDEESNKNVAYGKTVVKEGSVSTEVTMMGKIPDHYLIEAVTKEIATNNITKYSNAENTEWYEDFNSQTTNDFAKNIVLNLDEKQDTNYMVFLESTIFIDDSIKCEVIKDDEDKQVYDVYCDNRIINSLKPGSVFCYGKDNVDEMIIGKVEKIEKHGKFVEIISQKPTVEDAFQYIKIDYNSESYSDDYQEITTNSTRGTGIPETGISFSKDLFKITSKIKGSISGSLTVGLNFEYSLKNKYIKVTLSLTPSATFSVKASVDFLDREWLLSFTTVPTGIAGLSIDFKLYLYAKGSISGSLNVNVKKKFKWSYSNKYGFQNLSSPVTFSSDIKIEGSLEIGLKPYCAISLIHIVSVGYTNKFGIKISASQKFTLYSNDTTRHDCKYCLDGDLDFVWGQSARLEVNAVIWHYKKEVPLPLSVKIKLLDFYWSISKGDHGWGDCPHVSYLTSIKVVDDTNKAITNANVDGDSVGGNGIVKKWYTSGKHKIKIKASGYNSKILNIGVSEPTSYKVNLIRGSSDKIDNEIDSSYILYKKNTETISSSKESTPYVPPLTYTEPDGIYTLSTSMASTRSSDVAWVQRALKKLGYSLSVDGYYGNGTADAVKKFQKDYDINVTGKVDANTLSLIKNPVKKVVPPELKLTSASEMKSDGIATVSWKAVPHATAYDVYLYNSKGKLVNSISNTKATNAAFVLYEPETYTVKARSKNSRYTSEEAVLKTKITVHGRPCVTFVDWDGTVLSKQFVEYGASAVTPASPERYGYTFVKWDKDYSNVKNESITVNPIYAPNQYTVTFLLDKDGTQSVKTKCYFGETVTPPSGDKIRVESGYEFVGWDKDFSKVTEDIIVRPVYKWSNENLPVIIDSYSVNKDPGYGYDVSVKIRNYDLAKTNGRVVVALKTSNHRFVTMTESAAFALGKSCTESLDIFVPCKEDVSYADIFVVNSYNNLIPISEYKSCNLNASSSTFGKLRNITGKVDPSYANKQAILFIYKKGDAADYTNEYIGQTKIASDGSYSFDYCLREEPSITSGDFIVSLGIEGLDDEIFLDPVEAPKPIYTVTFKDFDGSVLKSERVVQGDHATLPDNNPEREGYTFAGWDYTNSSIYEDTTITAIYVHKTYTVVFIDWTNERFDMQTYYYGEPLRIPDLSTLDDYNAIGWEDAVEGMPVTGNMVITAKYEKKNFIVNFYDQNGNVIDSQTVEYGGKAVAPQIDDGEINFYDWDTENYEFVTSSMDVKPYFSYTSDTDTPYATVKSGIYKETINVSLNCSDKNAEIYYSINNGEFKRYSSELVISESSSVEFYASSFGKNNSSSCVEHYAINRVGDENNWKVPVSVYKDDELIGVYLMNYGSKPDKNLLYDDEYGYRFIGFSLDKDSNNLLQNDYTVTKAVNLYVVVEPEKYTVIFRDYDGEIIDTQVVEYMDSAIAPDVLIEADGMVFAGWSNDDFLCVTKNIEVYASVIEEKDLLGIKLSRNSYSMVEGYDYKIDATVNGHTDAELFWSSSDESIATVDENGNVTAISDGFVVITASLLGTDVSEDCFIMVNKNVDMSITLKENSDYFEYENFICGISPSANTVEVVKREFNAENVRFYKNGMALATKDLVSTGTVVKMFDEDNNEIDSAVLVVIGDVDGNGYADNQDAAHVSSYLVEKESFEDCYLIAADVNADGFVNNIDASIIMRYVVNKERI